MRWIIPAAAFTVLIASVCFYFRNEALFRIVGGVLQMVGVALVVVGIYRTLRRLRIGLRQLAQRLGIPLPKPKPVTMRGVILSYGTGRP